MLLTPCRKRTWDWRQESRLTCREHQSEERASRVVLTVRETTKSLSRLEGVAVSLCMLFTHIGIYSICVRLSSIYLSTPAAPADMGRFLRDAVTVVRPVALEQMWNVFLQYTRNDLHTYRAVPTADTYRAYRAVQSWTADWGPGHYPIGRLLSRRTVPDAIPLSDLPCIGSQKLQSEGHSCTAGAHCNKERGRLQYRPYAQDV